MRASVSQIKSFKACRRAWWFRWKEGLEPVNVSDALSTGKNYHALVESLEKGEELPDGFSKEDAMAVAFQKYILPKLPKCTPEVELFKTLGAHQLHGFVDGLTEDGEVIEHKTTSKDILDGGEYEYNLLWDEQILAYMSLTGARRVFYTVCKKPTIRLKKDETEEEFYHRMVEWYDDQPETKIRIFEVTRTDEEVAQFEQDFMAICDEMDSCANVYRNCLHCNSFGRRCEYSSICLNYDPSQEYVEFTKREVSAE